MSYIDLERAIAGPCGIDEGYTFSQTETTITITFKIPESILTPTAYCTINHFEGTIIAGIKGKAPSVCGKIWGRTSNEKQTIYKNALSVEIKKNVIQP